MTPTLRVMLSFIMVSASFTATSCTSARPFNQATPTAQTTGARRAATTRGSAPACRVGPATYRIVSTGVGLQSTIEGSCTFNPETVEGTCTNNYTDTRGTRFTTVSVTRHATRGDVVDEIAVIPPLNRSLGTTTTQGTPAITSTSAHEFDTQKRLLSTTATSRPSGQTSTTTYTAWDSAGRPTLGTVSSGPGRPSMAQSFTYDNATRTQTSANAGVTCTQTFDANGNPVVGRCSNGAATTMTVLTTHEICR